MFSSVYKKLMLILWRERSGKRFVEFSFFHMRKFRWCYFSNGGNVKGNIDINPGMIYTWRMVVEAGFIYSFLLQSLFFKKQLVLV